MPPSERTEHNGLGMLPQSVIDVLQKIWMVALLATVVLYGYLLYGLFTGQLANVPHMPKVDQVRVQHLVESVTFYLNVSLIATLITTILIFWESETLAVALLGIGAFLAYGLQLIMDWLFASQAANLTSGPISALTLSTIHSTAVLIAAPGVLLILRNLWNRAVNARYGHDLTATIGKDAKQEKVPRALVGAFANCWQLPFCREGVRVKCPIYHAKTKCWKQRVGCMCEENIIRLASGGEEHKPVDMTREVGFVPIGDLIVKSEAANRPAIPTRPGPRGVRIPTNPHLTEGQKRERCRNCVIFNEHQRQKYGLLSPLVTLAVPILVFLQFDNARQFLAGLLKSIDAFIGHINLNAPTGSHGVKASELTTQISGSLPIETIIIVCLTLVLMSYVLRVLEYCTFKIKI